MISNSLLWSHSVLSTTPQRWLVIIGSLPPELLIRKPKPTDWSAVECLQHLIEIENLFIFRTGCFLEGRDFPAFDPDAIRERADNQTPAEIAREFESLRDQSLSLLEKLTLEDLSRKVNHFELGPVFLVEMVNEWAAHDLNHTIQAEQAIMQPFISNCGPWKQYFLDHFANIDDAAG